MRPENPPHVAILLCTYNGARYLHDQLQSYLMQDHDNWSLWISDDGSTDSTLSVLRDFQAAHPDRKVSMVRGPRQGIGANFLSLMCRSDVPSGYVALSDQDDVWLPQKLSRGLAMLRAQKGKRPAIYASGYRVVDHHLRPLRQPKRTIGKHQFRNALTHNRLCGATMILPPQTLDLVRKVGPRAVDFHDWWLTQLVTGVGGDVLYDPNPTMLYRQHGRNALGANAGWRALARRLKLVSNGSYTDWHRTNAAALDDIWYELDPNNLQHLKKTRRRAA